MLNIEKYYMYKINEPHQLLYSNLYFIYKLRKKKKYFKNDILNSMNIFAKSSCSSSSHRFRSENLTYM